MQTNCIKNLLHLNDFIVKNINNLKDTVEIYIELSNNSISILSEK